MTVTKRIYSKALLLLTVFSLNTVVSFACSSSRLFHDLHHKNNTSTIENKKPDGHSHSHSNAHKHDHSKPSEHQHDPSEKSDDDCCSNSVVAFEKVDKSVSRIIEAPNVHFIALFNAFYFTTSSLVSPEKIDIPRHIRWRLPATIQDLRIVIQSFQI